MGTSPSSRPSLWLPRESLRPGGSTTAANNSPLPLLTVSPTSAGDAPPAAAAAAAAAAAEGPQPSTTQKRDDRLGPAAAATPTATAAAAAAGREPIELSSQLPISLLREIAAALPLQSPIKTAGAGRTKALLLEDLQAAASSSPQIKACIHHMLQQHERMMHRQQQQQQQAAEGVRPEGVNGLQQQQGDVSAGAIGDGSHEQQLSPSPAPLTRRVPLVQYLQQRNSSYAETARLHFKASGVSPAAGPAAEGPAAAVLTPAAAAAANGAPCGPMDLSGSATEATDTAVSATEDSSSNSSSSNDEVYVQVPINGPNERISADFVLIDTPAKARMVETLLRRLLAFLQHADAQRQQQQQHQQQQQQQQQKEQQQQLNPDWQQEAGGYRQPEGLVAMGLDVETTGLDPHAASLR